LRFKARKEKKTYQHTPLYPRKRKEKNAQRQNRQQRTGKYGKINRYGPQDLKREMRKVWPDNFKPQKILEGIQADTQKAPENLQQKLLPGTPGTDTRTAERTLPKTDNSLTKENSVFTRTARVSPTFTIRYNLFRGQGFFRGACFLYGVRFFSRIGGRQRIFFLSLPFIFFYFFLVATETLGVSRGPLLVFH